MHQGDVIAGPCRPGTGGSERTRHILVTIPVHTACDIGRGLAVRILKDAGYSVEEYLKERGK